MQLPRFLIGLLAVVLLVAGGGALGRLTAPRPAMPARPAAPRPTPPAPDWPGASRLQEGVPVGYTHTPPGAVAAAANSSELLSGPLIFDPAGWRAAAMVLYTPAAASRAIDAYSQVMGQQGGRALADAQKGTPSAAIGVPVSYRVISYDDGSAEVVIWHLEVGDQQGQVPSQSWSTQTTSLVWTGSDWKVSGMAVTAGPSPRLSDQPDASPALPDQLGTWVAFRGAAPTSESPVAAAG